VVTGTLLTEAHSQLLRRAAERSLPLVAAGQASAQNEPVDRGIDRLDRDPRLKRPLTLRRDNVTIEEALNQITELTGVLVSAEGAVLRSTPVAFRFSATPLRDAMDAISHLDLYEWRAVRGGWVLRYRKDPHAFDMMRPHSEAEVMLERLGKQFLDQFAALPRQLANQIGFNGNPVNGGQSGVPFSSLPGNMQGTVQGLMSAALEQYASNQGSTSRLAGADLGLCNIDLQRTGAQEGLSSYSVDISNGTGVLAASFVVFDDPKEGYQIVPFSDITAGTGYDDNSEGTSRASALQVDSRLKSKVTLDMRNGSIVDVMQQLGVKTKYPFIARVWSGTDSRPHRAVRFDNIAVADALDQLVNYYDGIASGPTKYGYTWGETRKGIVLIHIKRAEDIKPAPSAPVQR
jgi:hypothetical protein